MANLVARVGDALAWAMATGLGSGHVPIAPATAGSAVALFIYAIAPLPSDSAGLFALILGGFAAGVWATQRILRPGDKDPSWAVWDEFIGMWATCIFLPREWPWFVAAFFVFRLLDIVKPQPVRRLEGLPGGLGIMADDLAAGLIGAGLLNGVRLLFFG